MNHYVAADTVTAEDVRLRKPFIRLGQPRPRRHALAPDGVDEKDPGLADLWRQDRQTRPPLTRLVARHNNGLSLYLTAIFLAHLDHRAGQAVHNLRANAKKTEAGPPWSAVAGLRFGPNVRAVRTRVTRALDQLREVDLVMFGPGRHRTTNYEGFQLLRDDGSGDPYVVPGLTDQRTVRVPTSFFTNGWHLVLEPTEVALMLVILDASQRVSSQPARVLGIAVGPYDRWAWYGLSDEAYTSYNELAEFGLITVHDPLGDRRRRGRWRPPDTKEVDLDASSPVVPMQFTVNHDTLNGDALEVVGGCLRASPVPPRLAAEK